VVLVSDAILKHENVLFVLTPDRIPSVKTHVSSLLLIVS
jgi:hypothetical protein